MKCSTIHLLSIQLFIVTLTVIGSSSTDGSKSIKQLEQNDFSTLMPDFKQRIHKWMAIKRQDCELKQSNNLNAVYFDCALCKTSVGLVQLFSRSSWDQTVVSIIRNICTFLHIETADVCKGIVETFKEEFLLIAKNVDLSPGQICSMSMGSPCEEQIDARLNWTLPLPPRPIATRRPINRLYPLKTAARRTYKFLQISDTHVDLQYKVGANAVCNEPLCCRSESNNVYSKTRNLELLRKANFFGFKINYQTESKAGKWGSYGNCDVPMITFQQALKQIFTEHADEIDYVIWTGDVVSHDVWRQSKANQLKMLKNTGEEFIKYMNDTPVYPALGNHEGFPVNSFPPKDLISYDPDINMDWLYGPLSRLWGKWLPKATTSSIQKGAYYSVKVRDNLRIISLNTNYCNDMNWWLLINATDPESELTWLINQLTEAEKLNEKVHIIGHIPPGKNDCLQIWSENYYRIISRFNETIRGQFYGHTHSDEFELFFDHDQLNLAKSSDQPTELNPVNVAYLAPSITTFTGTNPGYRIYEIDANTMDVLNYHNYFLDLPQANARSSEDDTYSPEFNYGYNPIDHYGMPDLSAKSWLSLAERMFYNYTLLNDYLYLSKNKASSEEMLDEQCGDDVCKRKRVCELLMGKSHEQVLRRFQIRRNRF